MATSSPMIERKEFTCPRCGSHAYGSTQLSASPMVLERICHGYILIEPRMWQRACGFTWLDKDDDKYFRGTGEFYASSSYANSFSAKFRR